MTMHTSIQDTRGYRPCVGLCLFNQNGQVFVGERLDQRGAWQLPQGGIDEGEAIERAALRELYEETGIKTATIIRIHTPPLRYDIPDDFLKRIEWGHIYKGQEQYWVALRFTGTDQDIDLKAHIHPEFGRYQWVNLRDISSLAVPFKRDTYQQVIDIFKDIAP